MNDQKFESTLDVIAELNTLARTEPQHGALMARAVKHLETLGGAFLAAEKEWRRQQSTATGSPMPINLGDKLTVKGLLDAGWAVPLEAQESWPVVLGPAFFYRGQIGSYNDTMVKVPPGPDDEQRVLVLLPDERAVVKG